MVYPLNILAAEDTPLPTGRIDTYFIHDYNIIVHNGRTAGLQGEFMSMRPDIVVYEEYFRIVLEGDHQPGSRYRDKGHGGYYGENQIQGLYAHYYVSLRMVMKIELD